MAVKPLTGVVAVLAAAGLAFGAWNAQQITSLRHQVTSQQATMSRYRAELARASRVINANAARTSGQHRDLITCSDISLLIDDGSIASWWVDSGGQLASTPAALPGHCVNG